MRFLEHRIPPPVIGVLVAAAMWAVADIGPRFPIPDEVRIAATTSLALAGIGFDLLGLIAFRKSRTTINPLRPERSSALVTGGVYRVTRNPMYVGMALLLCTWAVYLSAWLPFAGLPVFVWIITTLQIRPEERILAGLFGEAYARYCARVRRWL